MVIRNKNLKGALDIKLNFLITSMIIYRRMLAIIQIKLWTLESNKEYNENSSNLS